ALGKKQQGNHALATGTSNRKSCRKGLEATSAVTKPVTWTIVEAARPRDDAASKSSDSTVTEVEIAAAATSVEWRWCGRCGCAAPQYGRAAAGPAPQPAPATRP